MWLTAIGLRLTPEQADAFVQAFVEASVLGEVRYVSIEGREHP